MLAANHFLANESLLHFYTFTKPSFSLHSGHFIGLHLVSFLKPHFVHFQSAILSPPYLSLMIFLYFSSPMHFSTYGHHSIQEGRASLNTVAPQLSHSAFCSSVNISTSHPQSHLMISMVGLLMLKLPGHFVSMISTNRGYCSILLLQYCLQLLQTLLLEHYPAQEIVYRALCRPLSVSTR